MVDAPVAEHGDDPVVEAERIEGDVGEGLLGSGYHDGPVYGGAPATADQRIILPSLLDPIFGRCQVPIVINSTAKCHGRIPPTIRFHKLD